MATRIAEDWIGTGGLQAAQERRKTRETLAILQSAYLGGPWQLPPDELARQLKEVDPGLLDLLLSQVGWDVIAGGYGADTTAERERTLAESVRLYKYSPLAQWAVWLWSNWGLGETLTITPTAPKAADVWEEFWEADRNARLFAADRIHELSHWLLVKGNRFLAFYASEVDGEATARLIIPSQIAAIVTNPDDDSEAWFYKRQYTPPNASGQKTLYYPDWETFFSDELEKRWNDVVAANPDIDADAERADRLNGGETPLGGEAAHGTVVCMLHIAHNVKDEGSLWGWPLLTCARPYVTAHHKFMEDRLSVASAVAMYVRRYQHGGGSRAQGGLIGTVASNLSQTQLYDTNPPAAAGASEFVNKATDVIDLPMRTGATDAKSDNEAFAWMALLGAALFPTSAGLDTARWATALEMDKAQSMIFTGYQSFWAAQWRRMVKIVLSYKEKYGGGSFEDKSAEVSVDSFSLADFPGVARTIGQLVRDALVPLITDGTIPEKAAREIMAALVRINLQALGVEQAQDIADAKKWQKLVDEEEEEKPEPQPPPAGFQFQPGQTPPTAQPKGQEPEVVERIAAMIKENLGRGDVGAQEAAEWALAQILEGEHGRMDQRQG